MELLSWPAFWLDHHLGQLGGGLSSQRLSEAGQGCASPSELGAEALDDAY